MFQVSATIAIFSSPLLECRCPFAWLDREIARTHWLDGVSPRSQAGAGLPRGR
ncbi:hypothetical protein [Kamptonema formosum]|uniref:hypothetical protein n=1 Tax=Kamptonema formosum TaxID=331992 RepID=UPI0012DFE7BF|nr:hypothetical protein [Oscillatoria sp. PCC 10802]